jgi:hypothetical protein
MRVYMMGWGAAERWRGGGGKGNWEWALATGLLTERTLPPPDGGAGCCQIKGEASSSAIDLTG